MRYVRKQLAGELCKDRVFVFLLLVLSAFTSAMYFFVHFSVDGNLRALEGLASWTEQQVLYRNGLISNGILARNVLLAFVGLTGFAFGLYFYRFFQGNQVELGCLKALGVTDGELGRYFALFAVCTALAGAVIGLAGGYAASDILIRAGEESYLVDGLVKGVNLGSLLVGLCSPPAAAGGVAIWAYGKIRGKETGILMAGGMGQLEVAAGGKDGDWNRYRKGMFRLADRAAGLVPEKHRLSVRLALRKPVPVLLILVSSSCFTIMFILAYSLTLSSGVIVRSQTEGHNYLYQTTFESPMIGGGESEGEVRFLAAPGVIEVGDCEIEQTIIGVEDSRDVFELMDMDEEILAVPKGDEVVVGNMLNELYGVEVGDEVTVIVLDGETDGGAGGNNRMVKAKMRMKVAGIAFNAASESIYIEKTALGTMLSLSDGAYSGIWSMKPPALSGWGARVPYMIQTHEEKLDVLRRDSVSNRSSAVINQVVGCFMGCILLYLALFLNFQDSIEEIQILRLMGYEPGEIRNMLIDIYRPVLWGAFFLTLWPGILMVKAVLKSLALQIGDYMPFQTNVLVIMGIFLLQNLVYWVVERSFQGMVRKS